MYAVIETGGKQYRVAPGDVIDVERGPDVGDDGAVRFERVLMVGGDGETSVGSPLVEGALVRASLVNEVRGPKIKVFKKKRRKGYRRTAGHRQDLLRVKIEGIDGAGQAAAEKPAKKKAAAEKPEKKAAAEKPEKKAAAEEPAAEKPEKKAAAKKPAAEKETAAAEPAAPAGGETAAEDKE